MGEKFAMTKAGRAILHKHPNGSTIYVAIPSSVVSDSTFPFSNGEEVIVEIYDGGEEHYFEENVVVIKRKETTK